MTYLELINRVLAGLRESQITGLATSGYPFLIGKLVNEAKEDIEDLGPWKALRTDSLNQSLSAGTASYTLSGPNERSYLLYLPTLEGSAPMAFITTADYKRRLSVIPIDEWRSLVNLYPDVDRACPTHVAFAQSSTGLGAHFWPTPDQTYNARFSMCIPQAELTSASTSITIPSRPVWQEALVRAMEERGEEFSGSLDAARARAARSLESAIAMDFGADPLTFTAE
jgi:hypothetical protein